MRKNLLGILQQLLVQIILHHFITGNYNETQRSISMSDDEQVYDSWKY